MRSGGENRGRLLLVILIVSALFLITLDLRGVNVIDGLRSGTQTALSPFQRAGNVVLTPVKNFVNDITHLGRTRNQIEELRRQNESMAWAAHVTHKNFYDYYKMFNGHKNLVTIGDIVNDGAIYIYPIEICFGLQDIYNNYSMTLNGIEYNYTFID